MFNEAGLKQVKKQVSYYLRNLIVWNFSSMQELRTSGLTLFSVDELPRRIADIFSEINSLSFKHRDKVLIENITLPYE